METNNIRQLKRSAGRHNATKTCTTHMHNKYVQETNEDPRIHRGRRPHKAGASIRSGASIDSSAWSVTCPSTATVVSSTGGCRKSLHDGATPLSAPFGGPAKLPRRDCAAGVSKSAIAKISRVVATRIISILH